MFERWKLQRERRTILKRKPVIDTSDGGRAGYLQDEFSKKLRRDLRSVERRLDSLATNRLIAEAEKRDIPIPSFEPPEYDDDPENTPEFRSQLRKLIDEEKMRRREVAAWWWKTLLFPAVASITGLIGAIIGLVAVLHGKK